MDAEDANAHRPPTVLQVLPALETGGVEQGTVDVAVATAQAGWRALVASAGGLKTYAIERGGGRHIALPLDTKNPLKILRNAARLEEVIRREQVDIVHARSRAPAWSAYIAAKRTGVRFLTTFHGTYNFKGWLKRRYNAVMAKGERVIAISHFIAEHVKRHYAVPDSRIRVVPRGIDLRHFAAEGVAAERMIRLAHDWQLPDGVPVVMLPGRLTRWKGQLVLIDALARITDRDFICLLVGSDQGRTGYRDALTQRVRERGLESRVFIRDDCTDMPACYMLADVVVSASTDPEAFGRIAAEAQAMGRPLVASAHGGVPEQVIDGETAFLVPPGDDAALAEGVARALALDAEQRAAMAAAAREQAQQFSKTRMCADTLAVYEELLGWRDAPLTPEDSLHTAG
ncbi:glycosyl transferase [Rhodovibrio salinarum]|uniref:Glycosyl transferase n=2 Tax=Rhodovibrio salinarum TaxID=1087 RepID=A0A934QLR9_9PROT|nr:glycosyltransferase family 4 protein [Rhodovibrio salinarum]MBK1698820.1 glycosyl transferase [Rhodovibrio salinarum]